MKNDPFFLISRLPLKNYPFLRESEVGTSVGGGGGGGGAVYWISFCITIRCTNRYIRQNYVPAFLLAVSHKLATHWLIMEETATLATNWPLTDW